MDNSFGKIAVTQLGNNGLPDHTTFSAGGIRRSFDSDQGMNICNEHLAINGERGSAVNVDLGLPSIAPQHQVK